MKLTGILRIIVFVIGTIGVFFLIRVMMAGDDAIEASAELQESRLTPFLYLTYIIFGVTVIITLLYALINLFKNPHQLKKALISIGLFAVVVVIGYVMAEGVKTELPDGGELSEQGSRLVGMGLYTFYILTIIAVVLIIVTNIRSSLVRK